VKTKLDGLAKVLAPPAPEGKTPPAPITTDMPTEGWGGTTAGISHHDRGTNGEPQGIFQGGTGGGTNGAGGGGAGPSGTGATAGASGSANTGAGGGGGAGSGGSGRILVYEPTIFDP